MRKYVIFAAFFSLTAALFYMASEEPKFTPAQQESLAKCLKDKGVKLYSTWWCGYCKKQEAAFGAAAKYLPKVECSSPGKHDQLAECEAAGIDGYPTWVFPDGSRIDRYVRDLRLLSEQAKCPL